MLIDKKQKLGYFHRAFRYACRTMLLMPLMILIAGCAFPAPSGKAADAVSRTGFYFDTVVRISIYGMPEEEANALLDGCMALAGHCDEELFSAHSERSALWRINHPAEAARETDSEAAAADQETAALIDTALLWQERTDGAFSPALGALLLLWNFGGDPPGPVPAAHAVREALAHTDPSAVHILRAADGKTAASVRIDDPALSLDLGGIAKGCAADSIKRYLKENGATSAVINLGGNVLLIGAKPDGSPFRVGIQDPGDKTGGVVPGKTLLTIAAADKSVVTSGIYERFFEENGVRYHHVLDPATGYPADSGLVSVTILSDDSTSGDALATACLVLGQEKGQALIESLPGVEALFILENGDRTRTAGFPDELP